MRLQPIDRLHPRIAPSYRVRRLQVTNQQKRKQNRSPWEVFPCSQANVVAKILRGEYVKMAELLQDNIALDNKLATVHSEGVSTGHLKSNKKA